MYECGNEFIGNAFVNDLIINEYEIKSNSATTVNPQVNYRLESIRKVISNLVRTFDLKNNYPDKDYPWSGILESKAFALRTTPRYKPHLMN